MNEQQRRMWLSPSDLESSGLRLFCVPHAGSGAAGFYRWKRLLPASIAVCPVLLPGREVRLAEPALADMAALASELHRSVGAELARPYAVFGHSMGALLAYEWIRRVAAEGLALPLCLFASGREAPQFGAGHRGLHQLPAEELVGTLKQRYGGEPEVLLSDPELRELLLPVLRADLRAVEVYSWTPSSPLTCDIRAVAGAADRSVSDEGLEGWKKATSSEFASRRFPGDHFYHFGEGQAEVLRFVAETLESTQM